MKSNLPHQIACLLLSLGPCSGLGQSATAPPSADKTSAQLEQRVEEISAAITIAQQQLAESQKQMLRLQAELQELRVQMTHSPASAITTDAEPAGDREPATATTASESTIQERVQVLEAAVKLHDQTKVESNSKYPLRVTGLILFNGFLNRGVPDNIDLPAVAQYATPTSGNGSLGGSFRQTILGLEGDGPRIGGAHTSASVDFDFFGGVSYSNYGTSAGLVRMRTASINFDWLNDSLSVGMAPPLISPLSPSSYATVAEPALAGAGNLWTWAPQLRYTHRMPLREGQLQFEVGLWDSAAAGYSSTQAYRAASPAELSGQPAYETRISYVRPGEHGLQVGASGYYSRQAYPGYIGYTGTENLNSWAGTFDARIPLKHFEISAEGYRGRSLGGLGGGVYKDAITGASPVTGASVLQGLNAIGGWTQFKTRFNSSLEANMSIGLDDGFARDFHAVVLPAGDTAAQLRARNKMVIGNLIFRPKTYIILSPEYRRIWTWPISGAPSTLDIFTLSAGYIF